MVTSERTNGKAELAPTASRRIPTSPVGRCQFELAAPRHFLYPALLLLLSEQPRHGYRLVDAMLRLGFGPVDRPAIYRALADLKSDGLLASWEDPPPGAGSTRNVYGVTEEGAEALRQWMAVLAEESHCLTRVLTRFTVLTAVTHGAHQAPSRPKGNGRADGDAQGQVADGPACADREAVEEGDGPQNLRTGGDRSS